MSDQIPSQPDDGTAPSVPFDIVPLSERHDGWTAARQIAFIQMLAETANVSAACRAVGMSRRSAYALYNRPEAQSFRQGWDMAIDQGTRRLADAALDRALNGVVQPVFYGGKQIGERRVFDERMTMFLLRCHAPDRYGAWRDRVPAVRPHPDGGAMLFAQALRRIAEDGLAMQAGTPLPAREPLRATIVCDDLEDRGDRSGSERRLLRLQLDAIRRENAQLRRQCGMPDGDDDPESGDQGV